MKQDLNGMTVEVTAQLANCPWHNLINNHQIMQSYCSNFLHCQP